MPAYRHHAEHVVSIPAPAEKVFSFLDDPARLGAHMQKSSWMMAGARMSYDVDAARGMAPGSIIRLSGSILGLSLFVEEVVILHERPYRKRWQTIGQPRLLVIGRYEIGFTLEPAAGSCLLRIHISYDHPCGPLGLLGWLMGGLYARWCVRSMAIDAARHFTSTPA
jgi:hypothetical protein